MLFLFGAGICCSVGVKDLMRMPIMHRKLPRRESSQAAMAQVMLCWEEVGAVAVSRQNMAGTPVDAKNISWRNQGAETPVGEAQYHERQWPIPSNVLENLILDSSRRVQESQWVVYRCAV